MASGVQNSSSEERSLLKKLKDNPQRKLRENYRLILNILPDCNDLIIKLRKQGVIDNEELKNIRSKEHDDRRKHCLLRHILKSDQRCLGFFQTLIEFGAFHELENISRKQEKLVPGNILVDYPADIENRLIRNRHNLINLLEVVKTRDSLLEFGVIDIEEHSHILQPTTRNQQRNRLFDILVTKDSWVASFIHVLKETDQNRILIDLQLHTNNHTANPLPDMIVGDFGNTNRLSDDEYDDVVINVQGNNSFDSNLLTNIGSNQQVMQDCIAKGILDIYAGNSINVYIPFGSRRIVTENKELMLKNLEPYLKLVTRNMTKGSIPHNLTVKVQQKAHTEYLHHSFEEGGTKVTRSQGRCFGCLKETVRRNMDLVLSEIESDIIEETFLKMENEASTFIRNACTLKDRPRHKKAEHFILYVMQSENALRIFFEVFKGKSYVDLASSKCKLHSNKPFKGIASRAVKTEHVFRVTFVDGELLIQTELPGEQVPRRQLRPIENNHAAQPQRVSAFYKRRHTDETEDDQQAGSNRRITRGSVKRKKEETVCGSIS